MVAHPSKMIDVEMISLLDDKELSAVTFVRDYVQLGFDGPVVTAITLPRVDVHGIATGPSESGYRDQLCGQISKRVRRAWARSSDRLAIEFVDGSILYVPLEDEYYEGPEAVVLRDDKNTVVGVW
jgi:hypothetical protein